MKILVGADPEVFVKDGNGHLVSAHGMNKGTKESPIAYPHGAMQVDGMALEFNINPASDEEEWVRNITEMLQVCRDTVPNGCELAILPTAEFGAKLIAAQPEEARELGCSPDFNAWTGDENVPPNAELPFRTGAGHIHIGFTEGADIEDPVHISSCRALVKQLDYFLGVPSVLLDGDTLRRDMYGAAGCFRPKSYGVEYRTLSNFWLQSEEQIRWAYRQTIKAVKLMGTCRMENNYGTNASYIINSSDTYDAQQLIMANRELGND